MVKSNQRITKIKRDPIEELLKKAEAMDVEDACQVQPQGMDLTPYPDMDNLRLWVHDYLLKGLNVIYNNDLSIDGQTYMTTIVDGLPLFTKLSKTIKQVEKPSATYDIPYVQPVLTENGTPGGNEVAMIFNHQDYAAFNISSTSQLGAGPFWQNYWIGDSERQLPSYVGYYIPDGIKLTSITLMNKSVQGGSSYTPRSFIIQGSNDNDVWTNLYTEDNWSYYNTWNTEINIPIETDYAYKYIRIYITSTGNGKVVQLGYMKLDGYVRGSSYVNIETTKPGLWLSNLCEPYQVSQAGGWLRQNLINDYDNIYTNLNSDTIGNYSFSYFQRGIIHRDAGSTHADNDSYCQHWSPSALGCISHDSLIIPTNNLSNTYTSYQTLAVPSDVDKQSYSETISKDVEFTFVDNNNNIPLTTTTFNGRVVGDGWTFEYLVSGNHQGSGTWGDKTGCDCDAETVDCEECPHCWSCVSEDIRNSGLCITGEIQYQNADGTVCIQAVNECFQTLQAAFQPNNPNNTEVINGSDVESYTVTLNISGDGIIPSSDFPSVGYFDKANITKTGGDGTLELVFEDDGRFYFDLDIGTGNCCPVPGCLQKCIGYGSFSGCGTCYIPSNCGSATLRLLRHAEDIEPQDNVNIYFCVTDEKKKQEAQGIPWNYTCGLVDRFTVSFSTTPCDDIYTKSYLVAENISISSLGDITGFNESSI